MLYYMVVFFVVALIASVIGFSGTAGAAAKIALFLVGFVLAGVMFSRSRGQTL